MVILAGLAAGALLLWTANKPLTRWAYEHYLFLAPTANPVFAFPGAAVPGSGPSPAATVTAIAGLIAALLGTIAAVHLAGALSRNTDLEEDHKKIPVTLIAIAIGAAAATLLALLIALYAPTANLTLTAICAALAAALGGAAASTAIATSAARHDLITELERATFSYLGYTKLPTRRFIKVTHWDERSPTALTLRYRGRAESVRKELGGHINEILAADFDLTNHRGTRTISAALSVASTEPEVVRRLRKLVCTKQYFDTGATVHDIDLLPDGTLHSFVVHHNIGAQLADSGRGRFIERKANVNLPGRWKATFDEERDRATFVLREEFPPLIYSKPCVPNLSIDEVIANYSNAKLTYAQDEDGNPIYWDPNKSPHSLVIGTTGSGKTSYTHTLVATAALLGWIVIVVDFKGTEFNTFRGWPNVQIVACDVEDAIRITAEVHAIMMDRYKYAKVYNGDNDRAMPILFVIDEYTEYVENITEFWEDHKPRSGRQPKDAPAVKQVASIARLARSCRIHMSVGLQRPDATIIKGEAKENFRNRVSCGKLSRIAADMFWESSFIGRSIPPGLQGRATAVNPLGVPVEVQCLYTPARFGKNDADDEHLRALLPPVDQYGEGLPHERVLVEPPPPEDEDVDIDGKPVERFFSYYQYALNLVRASDRPDLDPLSDSYAGYAEIERLGIDPTRGLNVGSRYNGHPGKTAPSTASKGGGTQPTAGDPDVELEKAFARLSEPLRTPLEDLEVGDWILINKEFDRWAILDEAPDLGWESSPGKITLFWRDPRSGVEGDMEVDSTGHVLTRTELESEEVAA